MGFDLNDFERGLQQQRAHEQATQYGSALQGGAQLSPQSAPYLAGQMSVKASQSVRRSFPIPINARSIHIYTTGDWSALTAVGDQTGISYFNRSTSEHFSVMPIAAGVDVSITVGITAKATADLTLYLVADPETVMAGLLSGPSGTNDAMPVSLANDQPPGWLVPTSSAFVDAALALNTTTVLVAGVAGKKIYIHSCSGQTVAAATALAWSGSTFGTFWSHSGTAAAIVRDFRGFALPAGDALRVFNNAADTVRASVAFSQF